MRASNESGLLTPPKRRGPKPKRRRWQQEEEPSWVERRAKIMVWKFLIGGGILLALFLVKVVSVGLNALTPAVEPPHSDSSTYMTEEEREQDMLASVDREIERQEAAEREARKRAPIDYDSLRPDRSALERVELIYRLAEDENVDAAEAFVGLLDDGDEQVRVAAASGLEKLANGLAIPTWQQESVEAGLVAKLESQPESVLVRRACVRTLGLVRAGSGTRALLAKIAKEDPDPRVREDATAALKR